MYNETEGMQALRRNPMMGHLLSALEDGQDIGHYGRLTFVMVGRHFLPYEDLVGLVAHDHTCGEAHARALVAQVVAHDYNPPGPRRIREWQGQQAFPICPHLAALDEGNVYRDLAFPPGVYQHLEAYYQHGPAAH